MVTFDPDHIQDLTTELKIWWFCELIHEIENYVKKD